MRSVPAGNHGAPCSKGLPPCRLYILVCLRNSQAKQREPGSKGLPPCRLGRRQRRVMYRYRQTAAVKGREHSGIGWIRAGLDRARDSDAKTAKLKSHCAGTDSCETCVQRGRHLRSEVVASEDYVTTGPARGPWLGVLHWCVSSSYCSYVAYVNPGQDFSESRRCAGGDCAGPDKKNCSLTLQEKNSAGLN